MTFIEQLLNGENVEWKKLGEVCSLTRGKRLTKRDLDINGIYPVYHGGIEPIGYYNKFNRKANSTMIINVGASAGTVGYSANDFWSSDGCFCFSHNGQLNQRYLYYSLQNIETFIKSKVRKAGIPTLDNKVLENIKIPLPPLSVQHRIVEILDKFTALEAELEAELDCRKRQYEYYRNQLLSFDMLNRGGQRLNDVKIMTLGEIGEIRMCKRILKGQTSTCGDVPFYKIGTFGKTPNAFISKKLFTEYKIKYSYPKIGEVLISASGTIGKTVIFDGQDAYFQDSNIVWIENDESMALNKYLYYCYQVIKWKTAEGGTINRLYNDIIKKTRIPLPPLSVQREIVEILDKFDTLTNSISEGLPKEIELRRKQYEYYRNQLLSFSTVKEKYHG